jgi:hypothetical protein
MDDLLDSEFEAIRERDSLRKERDTLVRKIERLTEKAVKFQERFDQAELERAAADQEAILVSAEIQLAWETREGVSA